jgi:putative cell wall-binding protein
LGAAAVLGVLLTRITGAGATSATFTSANASNGAIDPRVRIQTISVDYTASMITATLTVAQGTDPATDPVWTQQGASFGFLLQVGSGSSATFALAAGGDFSSNHLEGEVGPFPSNAPTCTGSAVQASYVAATAAYTLQFAPSCISSPAAFTTFGITTYQPNSNTTLTDSEPPRGSSSGCCSVTPPAGSGGGPTSTTIPGQASVTRLAGADRIETSIVESKAAFSTPGSATAAVIANDLTFADALPGTPLAAAKGGPLLLNPPDALNADIASELKRVLPAGATVYLLGGSLALNPAVANSVTALGFTVVRYAGDNRFSTAAIIADKGLGNPTTVLEATGLDFPDALSGGAAAAAAHAAVLLTDGSSQAAATSTYLSAHSADTRYALGGPAAAADPSAKAIVGTDRYDTARMVAQTFFTAPAHVGVASGVTFPDALSGGAQIARMGGPMLLTDPATLSPPTQSYLTSIAAKVASGFVYGGELALSDAVEAEVVSALTPAA